MSRKVMKQIIDYSRPLSGGNISHQRLWKEYLKGEKLLFSAKELHDAMQKIVNTPSNLPRGEKLLHLHQKLRFTLKKDKTPGRPEEALERFIIVSNGDDMFNQVPIGGGKESIDIVIRHNEESYEFVELKPWDSKNSPIYALVEGLKNLLQYRAIVKHKLQRIDQQWNVHLSIAAPEEYFKKFLLLNESASPIKENITTAAKLLDDLAKEFDTAIAIYSLAVNRADFGMVVLT